MSEPGPAVTQVKLTGPADEVARLMTELGDSCEIIFGPVEQPDRGGNVTCTAQVVTHPSARAPADGQTVHVTVQAVLKVAAGALPGTGAAQQVEDSVTRALEAGLPEVQQVSTRFISAVGLPAERE